MTSVSALVVVLSILGLCLIICTITDIRTGLILDRIVFPALSISFLVSLFTHDFVPAVIGALTNGGAMFGLRCIAGKNAMGLGDVKLALVIGSAFGMVDGFVALGAAFICGGAVAAALLLLRQVNPGTRIPFAPFLTIGSAVAIVHLYMHF